jgi:FkbM family methyltransferase
MNEDVIIDWLTGHKTTGTYIDIGACNPDEISNTKLFYERGWRGINIEPNTQAYRLFLEKRPGDTNINGAIGEGEMEYFEDNHDISGNTFTKELAQSRGLTKSRTIKLIPLREIFEKNNINRVDFMSIDVEGFEDQVIQSNDWSKYMADVICLEGYKYPYLEQFGYKRVFWDGANCYYALKNG